MNEIEVCEFEDLSNDNCVNCFNGLPHLDCPKEDAERKVLRDLVHKKAEANRRKAYEQGYEQGRADERTRTLIEIIDFIKYECCLEDSITKVLEKAEQLKADK